MKQLIYVFLVLCLVGCVPKHTPEAPLPNIDPTATIRYETGVVDTVNYDIKVMYLDGSGTPPITIVSSGYWTGEFKNIKKGTTLYISTTAIPKNDSITTEITVFARLYVNEKLVEKIEGEFFANILHVLFDNRK